MSELYERARRTIRYALQSNRITGRLIAHWPSDSEVVPIEKDPTSRQVPAVRLQLISAGGSTRQTNEGGPIVRNCLCVVSTFTRGPGNKDALYLWAAIESVLDPVDEAGRDELDALFSKGGIWSLRIQRPALPSAEAAALPVVESVGILEVQLWDEG